MPEAPFRPLSALLRIWTTHAAPPGFAAGGAAGTEQQAGARPQAAAGAANGDVGALNLPEDLHPGQEDVLSAALKRMDIKPAAEPAPAAPAPATAHAAAPARNDPVIDPALIKRIPSDKRLAALAPQQPSALLQQQGSLPLPYAAPGAPVPAEALEAFPFLQQQLPQPRQPQPQPQHMAHPMAGAGAGSYPLGHPGLGMQGPDAALMPPHHPLAPGQPMLHTHAHQQQVPLAGQMHSMPPPPQQQQELHAAPVAAWGHGLQQGQQQQQQQPVAQPAQPVGALSLLDIQREEQQATEAARIAAAQQQQPAVPLHYEVPAPPAPKAPAPTAPRAAPAPQPAPEEPLVAERARPETKAAPWAAAAAPKAQTGKHVPASL
jgi:nicotinate-nucleotide--dimethylbenzimidazole phosphoribosyltransferase